MTGDGTYQHTGPGFQTCTFCAKPGRYLEFHDEQYWHPMCWLDYSSRRTGGE